MAKEKPPILGMIQCGGQEVIQMLENVQRTTVKLTILDMVASETLIYAGEYANFQGAIQSGRHRLEN